MDEIARNPYARHNNVAPLQGTLYYRLRVGDWRIVYEIQGEKLIVQDANEIRARIERGEEETIPASLMRALVNSERPLRLWREYRGLTLQTLADRVGISKSYLSQIESGNRNGSTKVMKRIAAELNVSLDEIV